MGLSGATYKLEITDVALGVSAVFVLNDAFGMVLEGASGAIGRNSYEFAMPSLTIEGGTITMDGMTTELGGGNLWLDRQSFYPPSLPSDMEASLVAHAGRLSNQMYVRNWLGVVMNDQTVYVLVFYWPTKQQDQWIVGSELHPPVYPTSKMGLEYPPLSNWDYQSPVQGVNVLDSSEFNLNILDPQDPSNSPHWTSSTSHQTYCSAWRLRIRSQVYNMTALVPGSEVKLVSSAFFEGAATICCYRYDVIV